jgi:Uma2 family endonuclease
MTTSLRWTIADIDALPDNGNRYEIIDGEIYMSKQPHWHHQATCANITEVLSAGTANEQCDRDAKRRLYSRRGVQESWIADWRTITVEVYRRQQAELRLIQTLLTGDELTSPLLPGFSCIVERFFEI